MSFNGEIVEAYQNVFVDKKVNIINCEFLLCQSENNGGSIFSTDDIKIENCFFASNSGKCGGCIYSKSNISCKLSTFIGNSARYGGAIYSNFHGGDIFLIQQVAFSSVDAESYGSTYQEGNVNASLLFCNFTNCLAEQKTGGCAFFGGKHKLKSVYFIDCDACADVCLFISTSSIATITNGIFWSISSGTNEEGTSLVLNFDKSRSVCKLSRSFISIKFSSDACVCLKCDTGGQIIADACCIHTNGKFSSGNVIIGEMLVCKPNDILRWRTRTFVGFYELSEEKKRKKFASSVSDILTTLTIFVFTCVAAFISTLCLSNSFYDFILILQSPSKKQ